MSYGRELLDDYAYELNSRGREQREYNCPNCGAPIGYAEICPYCKTRLNWTPTVEILYTPTRYSQSKIEARAKVYLEDLRNGLKEGTVLESLRRQLAEQIPNIWEVRTAEDHIADSVTYFARILAYKKQEGRK